MDDIDKDLLDASEQLAPSQDKLDIIRNACKHARGLIFEIQQLQENLRERNKEFSELRYEKLPTLFAQNGVDRIDLQAEGNLPAYTVAMADHFHANIKAEWPQDQKDAAFDWLENKGLGDLIKRIIEIRLGLDEVKLYQQIMTALLKIPKIREHLHETRSVPWNTLSSWLREEYKQGGELGDIDLQRIGGFVGKVVNLKPSKEK